jgi:hypothetical protein
MMIFLALIISFLSLLIFMLKVNGGTAGSCPISLNSNYTYK